jgi:hypothetical protein
MSQYTTRKEIAAVNELSEKTIRRRERLLGLHECRDRACERPVRYDRTKAGQALTSRGYKAP